jgi:ketosteroid isomerase-like protein
MSQENVEIVRQAVQASIAKPPDFETVNALYHADHVLRSDWGVEGRTYRGASGFAEAIDDLNATWQEWRQEIDDILDAGGDDVVVLVRLVATGRQSGALVEQPWAMVITVTGGKLIASRTFLDRHRALKAMGLEE